MYFLFIYYFCAAEQTTGEVIPMEAWQGEGLRKVWGQTPVSEVLKILEQAELQPLTQCLDNSSICDDTHTGEHLICIILNLSM